MNHTAEERLQTMMAVGSYTVEQMRNFATENKIDFDEQAALDAVKKHSEKRLQTMMAVGGYTVEQMRNFTTENQIDFDEQAALDAVKKHSEESGLMEPGSDEVGRA